MVYKDVRSNVVDSYEGRYIFQTFVNEGCVLVNHIALGMYTCAFCYLNVHTAESTLQKEQCMVIR